MQMEIGKERLIELLACTGRDEEQLFNQARTVRDRTVGNGVYLRGLIEISNICTKDCFYCGIRKSNRQAKRYELCEKEVIAAAAFAHEHHFGSVVLQGGERSDKAFVVQIEKWVKEIKRISSGQLGITLSLGEQSEETYKRWFESDVHRYLLRIETSNETLYRKIHPNDSLHSFRNRLQCIERIQHCGYQTGTGVMIGLPFQTIEDLAEDLLFLQSMQVDMVGMGPYLEHVDTPLYQYRELLLPQAERLRLSLHMISCLRLLMPDINIAATTALQAIEPKGREKALAIGANILMPNITPTSHRADYALYQNKPGTHEGAAETLRKLAESVRRSGCEIKYDQRGDSLHFTSRHK